MAETTTETAKTTIAETTAVTTTEQTTLEAAATSESTAEVAAETTTEQPVETTIEVTADESSQPAETRSPLDIHAEIVANADVVRMEFTPLRIATEPDFVKYEGSIYDLASGFGTYCTIREETVIDEIRKQLSDSIVQESDSWYRTIPTVLMTFYDPEGNTCTYYFLQDYGTDNDSDVGCFCYTDIEGDRVVYCLSDESIEYFEELFSVFTLKNIVTWEDAE